MKKILIIGATLLLSLSAALGQVHEGPPHGPDGPPMMHGPGGPPPGDFNFEGRTVAGAPFTAQIVSTSSQTLSDGSHISRNVNATVARDGQGRTYRQQTIDGPISNGASKSMIFLRDPVAHTSYVISPDTKSATLTHMPQHQRGPRVQGPPLQGATPDAAGPRPERRVRARNGETVETLSPQMMEGVWAEGTRITRTIPVGAIGNDHELKIVSESWYSKDLQMVVMSKHSDPRMGESTFRMTNIQRSEPDATMFQAPAGYKITEHGRVPHQ
jgi:hypothetical protein